MIEQNKSAIITRRKNSLKSWLGKSLEAQMSLTVKKPITSFKIPATAKEADGLIDLNFFFSLD